jgi:tetratricopeptide (TPR) repeat protein
MPVGRGKSIADFHRRLTPRYAGFGLFLPVNHSLDEAAVFSDNDIMSGMLPIVAGVVVLGIGAVFIMMMGRSKGGNLGGGKRSKGRDAILKDANKRLAQNPRDPEALSALADLYFREEVWDKAFKNYEILTEIGGSNQYINEFEANQRYALSAMKLGMVNEAYKGFTIARNLRHDNFEVNLNLGNLEFQKKNYEKAIQLLQAARAQDPENAAVLRSLGHSLFRLKKYKEAMAFIRKAMDNAPDDKESLYTLGECYYEANQTEQALRIFSHLRPDPVMGASASLFSGTINMEQHQYEKAIQDFEIGLKHENIKPEILIELRYRLATTYLKQNDIGKALPLLKDIQAGNPGYRDVSILIGKYQELNANKNLQIFMMAPSADFVALCRKIVLTYYARAKVKITNISVNKNEWADILAEIDTPKWSDVVMFRFIRSPGSVGELIVRDFHSHLKEVKAGKGICISVGAYTEEAKRYTEARLIDLIEKEKLTAILNTVDARAQAVSAKKR